MVEKVEQVDVPTTHNGGLQAAQAAQAVGLCALDQS